MDRYANTIRSLFPVESQQLYTNICNTIPNYNDCYNSIAVLSINIGYTNYGIQVLDTCLKKDPNNYNCLKSSVEVHQLLGNKDKLMEIIKRAREVYPNDLKFMINEMNIHVNDFNFIEAMKISEKTLKLLPYDYELLAAKAKYNKYNIELN